MGGGLEPMYSPDHDPAALLTYYLWAFFVLFGMQRGPFPQSLPRKEA